MTDKRAAKPRQPAARSARWINRLIEKQEGMRRGEKRKKWFGAEEVLVLIYT